MKQRSIQIIKRRLPKGRGVKKWSEEILTFLILILQYVCYSSKARYDFDPIVPWKKIEQLYSVDLIMYYINRKTGLSLGGLVIIKDPEKEWWAYKGDFLLDGEIIVCLETPYKYEIRVGIGK